MTDGTREERLREIERRLQAFEAAGTKAIFTSPVARTAVTTLLAAVTLDERVHRIERQQTPAVDDGDAVTEALCLFHT